MAALLWRIDPAAQLPAPVAAGAWIALDHVGHARRVIAERCAVRAALCAAIHAIGGYVVAEPGGPGLFVQRPGVDGEALREALAAGGLLVAHAPHHTWRDGVAMGLPTDTVIERVVLAFRSAVEALERPKA
jgi:histidinol-phosphate/aromatic aminotransferase/cobyric acid decarboxylase-like protein